MQVGARNFPAPPSLALSDQLGSAAPGRQISQSVRAARTAFPHGLNSPSWLCSPATYRQVCRLKSHHSHLWSPAKSQYTKPPQPLPSSGLGEDLVGGACASQPRPTATVALGTFSSRRPSLSKDSASTAPPAGRSTKQPPASPASTAFLKCPDGPGL